jgi:hypothetical protein
MNCDEIQRRRKLIGAARSGAFPQQRHSDRGEAFLAGGIGQRSGIDERRETDQRQFMALHQQEGHPIR